MSGIYAKYYVKIMLLFVYTTTHKRFVIFTCRYFKLSWNTTVVSQSNCSNFSCSSIKFLFIFNWLINSCTFSRNQGRAPQWSKWKLKMQKSKNKWLHVFKRSLTVMLQRCSLMLHKCITLQAVWHIHINDKASCSQIATWAVGSMRITIIFEHPLHNRDSLIWR